MRKSGFSIIELLITLTAMMILMAATTSVVYQKTKTDRKYPNRIDGWQTFQCQDTALVDPFYDFTINEEDRADFVAITLVGGGAGGGASSQHKGGAAGEVVEFTIPYMEGVYRAVLGAAGSVGQNGGATALYYCPTKQPNVNYGTVTDAGGNSRMTCSSHGVYGGWVLLKSARGGMANNELAGLDEDGVTRLVAHLKGERTSDENRCGYGGDANQPGTKGAVYISW